MCKEDKMICSNEGKTYPTICSLNEEAIERGEPGFNSPKLFMEYWGPCKEGMYRKSIVIEKWMIYFNENKPNTTYTQYNIKLLQLQSSFLHQRIVTDH